jgi:hypothetical protein
LVAHDSTDNTTALQTLLNTAKTAAAGARLFFPPLYNGGRAKYRFSGTLDVTNCSNVQLVSTGTNNNAGGAELKYTSAGSAPGIRFGSSRGFGVEGLAVTYSNLSYTGILLDGSKLTTAADTAYSRFERGWIGPSPLQTEGGTATLMCIDGSHDVDFAAWTFFGGNIQLIGKRTQGISSTGGFAIRVTMNGVAFAGAPTTAAILNPDESWDINCVGEPLASGRAALISHDAGLRARGVLLRECWVGDVTTLGGSWVTWAGEGLTVLGGTWAGNSTVVKVDADNCHGISVMGIALPGNGIAPVVSYGGGTAGHSALSVTATDLGAFTTISPIENPPTGYVLQELNGQLTIGGVLSVGGSATFASTTSSPGATVVGSSVSANLLTAQQASYETAGGWQTNLKLTVAQNTSQSLVGTKSVQITVTDTSAANTLGSPSFIQTSADIVTGIVPGQVYTAIASGKALDSAQSYRLNVAWSTDVDTAISNTYGPITAGSTTGWTKFTWTGTAPANAATARITVFVWTAGGSVNDRHVFDAFQFTAGTSTVYSDPGGAPAPLKLESVPPTSPPPNNGVSLYVESGQLKAMKANGTVVTLA